MLEEYKKSNDKDIVWIVLVVILIVLIGGIIIAKYMIEKILQLKKRL